MAFETSVSGQGGAAPGISINVNLAQVDKAMREVSKAGRKKILGQIVLQGARIFRKEMIHRAPIGRYKFGPPEARLRRSIVVKKGRATEVGLKEELARVIVSRRKHNVFYAHLAEFGHLWVRRRGGKTVTSGHTPASPFMMPTWEAKKDEASKVMLESLRRKVIRHVNKIRKTTGRDRLSRGFAR